MFMIFWVSGNGWKAGEIPLWRAMSDRAAKGKGCRRPCMSRRGHFALDVESQLHQRHQGELGCELKRAVDGKADPKSC